MLALEFPAWDPVFLDLPGPIDLRWYGLMYVVGFLVGHWILVRLSKRGFLPIDADAVAQLLVYVVFGVLLGGRIGYALIYDHALLHPVRILQMWQGGLSFHGGLTGVAVAVILFARRYRAPTLRVGDACALATPPGIFAVRFANFINGELYGRVTTADTFGAMQFPTDPAATARMELYGLGTRERELAIQMAYGKVEWADVEGRVATHDANGDPIPWDAIRERLDWETVREGVPYRHPSQLYEGLCEGLLLGLLLFLAYRATRRRPLGHGAYFGLFLIGYGVFRFFLENLRQPDAQFTGANDPVGVVLLGMTMGQTLCASMVLIGTLLLWWSRRTREPAPAA
ncbi:MAG: prolipoprotein diacylglyceryl transferase [Planctomycetota bacterium]